MKPQALSSTLLQCAGAALFMATLPCAAHAASPSIYIAKAFVAADRNHDGRLDPAEFASLPPAIRDSAIDLDRDGYFTLAELSPSPRQIANTCGLPLTYVLQPTPPRSPATCGLHRGGGADADSSVDAR